MSAASRAATSTKKSAKEANDYAHFEKKLIDGEVDESKQLKYKKLLEEFKNYEDQMSRPENMFLAKFDSILATLKPEDVKGFEVQKMFKCYTGSEATMWNIHREVEHRIEFLKRAQQPLDHTRLFIGGADGHPHDRNLDRLMDFILLADEKLDSLQTTDAVRSRCSYHHMDAYLNPEEIFKYVTTMGGTNRRTRWTFKDNKEPEKQRLNPQAGRSGYSSDRIIQEEMNTTTFGRFDRSSRAFVDWDKVNEDAMSPFKDCVSLLVRETRWTAFYKKHLKDALRNLCSSPEKRVCDKDRALTRGNRHAVGPKRHAPAKAALLTAPDTQTRNVCTRIFEQNMKRFQEEWENLMTLSIGWQFPNCLNLVWSILELLSDSMCLVFSRPDMPYSASSTSRYRRLDDMVSYADPELTKLITEYELSDQEEDSCTAHCDVGGSVHRMLLNQQMKDANLPAYKLQPFSFVYDCKRSLLLLASAHDFFYTNPDLFFKVRSMLATVSRECLCSSDEMVQRMNDPEDSFFGCQDIHALIGLEFNLEEIDGEWIHRRASLQELQQTDFPFKTSIFAEQVRDNGIHFIHDGRSFYTKWPGEKWNLAEVNRDGVIEIEAEAEADTSEVVSSSDSGEPDEPDESTRQGRRRIGAPAMRLLESDSESESDED